MEMCRNDNLGTVCDQMWDVVDASVVCRQLGYSAIGMQGRGHQQGLMERGRDHSQSSHWGDSPALQDIRGCGYCLKLGVAGVKVDGAEI